MSAKQKVGTIQFSAPIISLPGAYSVTASDAPRIKHQIALLNRALHVFGSYRAGRDFQPENGAISIDIFYSGLSGDSTFDASAFYELARKLNDACAKALNTDQDEDDLSAHSKDMAEKNNLDAARVQKVLETAKRHSSSLVIIDNSNQLIPLGSLPRPAHEESESIDIDVATCTDLAQIGTDENSYVFLASLVTDVKLGDKIQVLDIGPTQKRRCIAAESAAPIADPTPDLFE